MNKCSWSECNNKVTCGISNNSSKGELNMCRGCHKNYLKHLDARELFFVREAKRTFADEVRKGLFKLKGKVIEKDIGEYDKEVSCWDVQDLMKKILKTSQKQRNVK